MEDRWNKTENTNSALIAFVFCIPLLIFAAAVLLMPRPLYHTQDPISALVTDNKGAGVSEVVVVATWKTERGWFHVYTSGYLDKQIAITDEQGKFYLPGWSKRWNRWGLNSPTLKTGQPEIVFFKFGYEPKKTVNTPEDVAKPILRWRGEKTIKLDALPENPAEAYRKFSDKSGVLNEVIPPLFWGCEWKRYKRLLVEFDKQKQVAEDLDLIARFISEPIRPWFIHAHESFEIQFPGKRPDCPGAIDWLTQERLKRKKEVERQEKISRRSFLDRDVDNAP